jgi:serine/threonine protein kinase
LIPSILAPEVINRKPYDQKVDMWSIGVTAYLLLCGETPFNGKNRQQLFRRISCDDPTFPDDKWGHISDEAVDLVRKLLTKDPAKRLSAKEALHHRWLSDHPHHRAKTPSYENVTDSSQEFSELTDGTKRSRDPPDVMNHHSSNGPPFSTKPSSFRASSSRSSRPPPPPPPPHTTRESTGATSKTTHSSDDDDKARLLDVIKEQDAKIERLERMVKRMMEPEGAVHEC